MAGEDTAPFRQAPPMLACPRCGEALERVMSGVEVCGRCEGVWLTTLTLDRAFGTPYWPKGASAWWRRALECPVCSLEGRGQAMTPVQALDLFVDRCVEHGVWLDAGELGRLLDAPRAIELEAFHELLRPDAELPPRLAEFRTQRQAERQRRAQELEAFRIRVGNEQAQRRAAEAAAQAAERAREREAARAAQRVALQKLYAEAKADEAAGQREVTALRGKLAHAEGKLADARGRMTELVRQLEQLEA